MKGSSLEKSYNKQLKIHFYTVYIYIKLFLLSKLDDLVEMKMFTQSLIQYRYKKISTYKLNTIQNTNLTLTNAKISLLRVN